MQILDVSEGGREVCMTTSYFTRNKEKAFSFRSVGFFWIKGILWIL